MYNKNESNPVLGTPTVKRELKATREILRASDGVLCDCAVVEYWSPVVDGEKNGHILSMDSCPQFTLRNNFDTLEQFKLFSKNARLRANSVRKVLVPGFEPGSKE